MPEKIGSASVDLPTLAVVDGQYINLATSDDLITKVYERAQAGLGFSLFTLNLDHLVRRRADMAFNAAYSRATFVCVDGAPVVALARRQGAMITRTTGADLVDPLCAMAERKGISLFFFGSTSDQLDGAAAKLQKRYPRLRIAGCEAPPFGFEPTSAAAFAAADRIAASGAQFCLIALGAPKPELFADTMHLRHPHIGFFCVGAALDFIAGGQRRAPKWVQFLQLEWVWRLLGNPRRMTVRYARCAMLMVDLIFQNRPATNSGAP